MTNENCSALLQTRPTSLYLLLLWFFLLPAQAEIRVVDDAGQPVTLERPAQRIISLAPHVTELLFAAGAGEAIVGVSAFSDYPEAASTLTQIGDASSLDLEAIVALRPDLVVAWQSGNPRGQAQRLQALGITVFYSEPRQLADVPATLMRLGRLAGTESAAAIRVDSFKQRYARLYANYAQRSKVRVFYQIWGQPLMTLNGDHLVSDVLRLCGGVNVFDTLPTLAPQINVEAVLQADPDVIIVAADDADSPLLQAWQRWPQLSAVKQDHVYAIPRDLLVRHSPRILDGAEYLCELLAAVRK